MPYCNEKVCNLILNLGYILLLKKGIIIMNNLKDYLKSKLTLQQFPLSAKYDIEWINENEMGPNSI